jgi:pyridoxine kinase
LSLLREKDPGTVYVCDPVLGDNGKLYTKPELVDIFVEEVIPLADIVTPNQFELELLTKQKVETDQDITKAISILHSKGPHTVVVTSVSKETEGEGGQAGDILVIASTTKKQDQGYHPQFKIRIPRLDSDFTGTGDLTAALLLAWCDTYPGRLQEAVLRSMSTVYKILQDTVKFNSSSSAKTQSKSVIKTPELRLVQNQGAIKSPSSSQIFVVEPL